jgi:hypothetical protein
MAQLDGNQRPSLVWYVQGVFSEQVTLDRIEIYIFQTQLTFMLSNIFKLAMAQKE